MNPYFHEKVYAYGGRNGQAVTERRKSEQEMKGKMD